MSLWIFLVAIQALFLIYLVVENSGRYLANPPHNDTSGKRGHSSADNLTPSENGGVRL